MRSRVTRPSLRNGPERLAFTACLGALFVVVTAATRPALAATPDKPYWALLRDGTLHNGRQLREWHHASGHPTLDKHKLFEDNNPLRLLIHRDLAGRSRVVSGRGQA